MALHRHIVFYVSIILGLAGLLFSGCQPQPVPTETPVEPTIAPIEPTPTPAPISTPSSVLLPELPFYLGVDLSYVNELDDCGAGYYQDGESVNPYQLFADHGATLVRARLWHNPDWTNYSTVDDIERTFRRAKDSGMRTLLDFHYSDDWADPGKQTIPEAWMDLSEEELPDAVYQYTYDVLIRLYEKGLLPEFVQVGNEINSGMLKRITQLDWPRDAVLINAGIKAVRDVAAQTHLDIKIILHVAQPENAGWWFRESRQHGITDFDIIGLSYYPQWSSFSVGDVGAHVTYLRQEFGKEVMIVETAYPWTMDSVEETADNILNQGIRSYSISPQGQRQFMIDLTQSLISNGALGVIYWEPAWVSTDCPTRWGQGSHWENATFFDFTQGNEVHEGIEFLSHDYQYPGTLVDGALEDAYGQPILEDEIGDNVDQVAHLDLTSLSIREDAKSLYLGVEIAGEIYDDPWGSYMIYFDTTGDENGAKIDVDRRPISVIEPYYPEFRLDISAMDRKGTVSGTFAFHKWDGQEWQTGAMIGGSAMTNGTPSLIELQLPKSMLDDPQMVNIAVISVGRGRVHTAGDIMGTAISPQDWNEPLTIDTFAEVQLSVTE